MALTFDDAVGENASGLLSLLDLLDAHSAKATFFVIANETTTRQPDLLRNISARGHEVGNHGVADSFMTSLTEEGAEQALLDWEQRTTPVLGGWPRRERDRKWFRPPKGAMSAVLASTLARLGSQAVLGDLYSDDWLTQDTEFHVRVIEELAADGSIMILHVPDRPARMHTLDIIQRVVPTLAGRGFSFVRLSELFDPDLTSAASPRTEVPAFVVGCICVFGLLLMHWRKPFVCIFPFLRSGIRTQQELTNLANPMLSRADADE